MQVFFTFVRDKDPDDNKYCDCAIAGNAKYLVTEDKHFQILKSISIKKE